MNSSADTIEHPKPRFAPWLLEPMLRNKRVYLKVALAAAMINLFGLITSLFTMTVYDRVVPNNAYSSLVALSIGLLVVVVFDFVLRILRAYFVDLAGADIDHDVGGRVFKRLVGIRLDLKRGSTGSLTGMMRELETLRDFFASATMTAMVDVPFIVVTLVFIAIIGGMVVWVPLAAIPIVIGAGWLTRPALDRLSAKSLSEGQSKQSVLVETIGALEMVKTSGAATLLGRRWTQANRAHSDSSMRQRLVSTIATTVAASANTLSYAGTVVAGVFLIADHKLTTGALVACSILSGRAVQPLAQVATLLTRLSATRTAYKQINGMMEQPTEGPQSEALKPAHFAGRIELRGVEFRYPGAAEKTLDGLNLTIPAGQRIGLLGRVGSGKSTIARMILGLYPPQEGLVMIDGTDIRQFDPHYMRARIGTALQDSVLLSGSVRENIVLDRPGIDDAEMLRAAELSGTHQFMGQLANGYDLILADRGEGLSGGQRQSIALARALAGRPPVVVFDEPTSAMDQATEALLIDRLAAELEGRTFVLITHRPALLRLVERIVVIDAGRVVNDGPRDAVLQQLQRPRAVA
ncbi:type I secretion system permease/ATPase [Sphingomonas sp. RP10(2022)]|uniref:Type I secretion system permease/ATPase n=1 Tax=Sphingomonas liriopis TaxID=2949094 RepID=A0A9X2KP23_9SPHN|nr:type I secretion system permease/ATPase [Sphingomonas liriopis]MCP3733420.1 type I secretion system permease/ATPase [Sphingomonas liriopis]